MTFLPTSHVTGSLHLLAKDLEEVVEDLRVVEALDEDEEGDRGDAPVQRVVEADLAEELHHEERVA